MAKPLRIGVICAALSCVPARASAAEWYGWQTLAIDGGAVTLGVVSFAALDGTATNIGVGIAGMAYGFGPPIVHAIHGRGAVALGDLGLRIILPLGGAAIGALATKGDRSYEGVFIGGLGGALVAVAIDAAVLAWKPSGDDGGSTSATGTSPRMIRFGGSFR